MTREEYRNHVHTMVELVMDIQEVSAGGIYPNAGIELYRGMFSGDVWVQRMPEDLKGYSFSYPKEKWEDEPEQIIEMLQKIKAELDKKKSSATDQSKTELN